MAILRTFEKKIHITQYERFINLYIHTSLQIRCVELSEWRTERAGRVYRDWAAAQAHDHPPATARMPKSTQALYNG